MLPMRMPAVEEMLEGALGSDHLGTLLWVAAALGCIHTILGPDHYVPFVMMAKAERWSPLRTSVVTFLCGVGHVSSSVIIGAGLAVAGTAWTAWYGSTWQGIQDWRGDLAAWMLIAAGGCIFIWGLVRAARNRPHAHVHAHANGTIHEHTHDHHQEHAHVHASEEPRRRLTPWILFVIFVFGPCESLVPLMLAAWAVSGLFGAALVAACFSFTTVVTIMASVAILLLGMNRLPFGNLERYSLATAGSALVACGVAIQFGL
jgi:ABC-type nickel/cobalt efflux system permease component RcnA